MEFNDNFKNKSIHITAENSLCNIQKDMAEAIIELKNKENELIKENELKAKELITQEERAKAYGYDSLVYRFKDYQARAFPLEVMDYKYQRNASEIEARLKIKDRHERDLMRFIDILNDLIGEHK